MPRDYSLLSTDRRRNIYIVVSYKLPWFFAIFRLLFSWVCPKFLVFHLVPFHFQKGTEDIARRQNFIQVTEKIDDWSKRETKTLSTANDIRTYFRLEFHRLSSSRNFYEVLFIVIKRLSFLLILSSRERIVINKHRMITIDCTREKYSKVSKNWSYTDYLFMSCILDAPGAISLTYQPPLIRSHECDHGKN